MSRDLARGPQSYRNEQLAMELAPELLRAKGFDADEVRRRQGMKFIAVVNRGGDSATFWLKQGWSESESYSAIQFGMLPGVRDGAVEPDSTFVQHVSGVVDRAGERGATHALLVHMVDGRFRNYAALRLNDVKVAYQRQIQGWPRRARNSKIPTLYFEDSRPTPDAACIGVIEDLELGLERVARSVGQGSVAGGDLERKLTVEVERRLNQRKFRFLVGERFGWRCAVTGVSVRETLDAAHLPGKDWRRDNEAGDGILLRADLHRLLDRGLARVESGRFILVPEVRNSHYSNLNGRELYNAE